METERLRYVVHYDPETGIFRWKNPNKGKARPRQIIRGWNAGKGYLMVTIDFERFYLHRLAWQYVYGEVPEQLDHINMDKTDNRIANLRKATTSQNGGNQLRKNKSGFKGAYFDNFTGRYLSFICKNRVKYFLGRFNTAEEAHAAYIEAAKKHFGEFARFK